MTVILHLDVTSTMTEILDLFEELLLDVDTDMPSKKFGDCLCQILHKLVHEAIKEYISLVDSKGQNNDKHLN